MMAEFCYFSMGSAFTAIGQSPTRNALVSEIRRDNMNQDFAHRSELQHPAPDGFVGDVEPTFREEILYVSVAEREAQVEPDGMLDDNRRKPVTTVSIISSAYSRPRSPAIQLS
jgi:hypothetical protein